MPYWTSFEWAAWIATIVGGILGVVTIAGWWSTIGEFYAKRRWAPKHPASPANVIAYAKGHIRPRTLIVDYANRRGLKSRPIWVEAAWLHERVDKLGIRTIRELDRAVRKHHRKAFRLMDLHGYEGGIVDVGDLLEAVFDVVAYSRGGREGLQKHFDSLRHSSVSQQWVGDVAEVCES